MDIKSGVKSPFTNHSILQNIAEYLPLKELKEARLVNKLWYMSFSDRIFLKFENYEDYSRFLYFHQYKTNLSLKIPYKNLNLENWPSLETTDCLNILIFKDLHDMTNIRRLILSKSECYFSNFVQILRLISSQLEYLQIGLNFDKEVRFEKDCEIEFSMSKLKHLHLVGPSSSSYHKITAMKVEALLKMFKYSVYLTEITIQDSMKISQIMDPMMTHKPGNLKKINFSQVNERLIEQKFIGKVAEFSKKFDAIEIDFFGNKFTSFEAAHFFKIYYGKREKLIKNLQLKSVKVVKGLFYWKPLQKYLFHFPNLQKITMTNRGSYYHPTMMYYRDNQLYENLNELNLKTEIFRSYSDSIKNFTCFPNLTKLNLAIITLYNMDIGPIFKNLIKLKELTIDYQTNPVNDTHLTGISQEFIKKELFGKSLKFLLDFNPERNHPGIMTLKDLEKLSLTLKKAPTVISLFYGFRFLPKLKYLKIHGGMFQNVGEMRDLAFLNGKTWKNEYWDLFLTEFKDLESLNAYSGYTYINNDTSHYKKLKINNEYFNNLTVQRPQLNIQILKEP